MLSQSRPAKSSRRRRKTDRRSRSPDALAKANGVRDRAGVWISGSAWLLVSLSASAKEAIRFRDAPLEPWSLRFTARSLLPPLALGLLWGVPYRHRLAQRKSAMVGGVLFGAAASSASGYLLYYAGDMISQCPLDRPLGMGLAVAAAFLWHRLPQPRRPLERDVPARAARSDLNAFEFQHPLFATAPPGAENPPIFLRLPEP